MIRGPLSMCLLLGASCGGIVGAAPGVDGGSSQGASSRGDGSLRDVAPGPVPFDATGIASCSECLAAACMDVLVQCEQSATCNSLLECATRDGGTACDCASGGDGTGPFLATARCLEEEACQGVSCASVCSLPDSGSRCSPLSLMSCEPRPTSSSRACNACVAEACGGFASACGADCQAYVVCALSCQSPSCETECRAAHAAGATNADALDVCLGSSCGAECDF